MSLVSLLSIARSALIAHQRAMEVISNNVANAQTPGYTRQRQVLVSSAPLITPNGTVGTGVSAATIERLRDQFHDATYRQENGQFNRSSTLSDMLGQVESAMNEPSDTGVASALDGFFSAFSDLSNSPSSSANRESASRAAQRLVDRFHALDTQVTQGIANAADQLRSQVAQVNSITTQLATLNAKILAAGGPDQQASDLQDQRDHLVDELSGLVSTRVTQNSDGTYTVTAGSAVLVDRGTSRALEVRSTGGTYALGVVGQPDTVDPESGSLRALLDSTNTKFPAIRAQLDTLAQALVTQVNTLHESGYTATGATGTDFFDPAHTTAGTLQLTAAILASSNAIAADGVSAPSDGTVAAKIAALGGQQLGGLGNRTLRDFYVDLASSVGSDAQAAAQDTTTYDSLATRSDTLRQSVTGVNLDEEMTALIAEQQAYAAAARVITVADDMMTSLLNTT